MKSKLKKNYDEFEKWDNSIEGVMYNLCVIGDTTTDDEKDKVLIAKTLLKLPKKIRERVLDEAMFVILSSVGTVEKIRLNKIIKEKDTSKISGTDNIVVSIEQSIILLNLSPMKSESGKINAIAHEIAHFILGDYSYDPRVVKAERRADDLIEKWGFKRCYESYKRFELK